MLIVGQSLIGYLIKNSYPLLAPEVWIAVSAIAFFALAIASSDMCQSRAPYRYAMAAIIAVFLVIEFEEFTAINRYGMVGLALGFFVVSLKLRERTYPLAAVVFAAFLVGSFVEMLQINRLGTIDRENEVAVHSANSRPRIIHLILDEHIGLEGIPSDTESGRATKELIKDFYRKYDFFVYGGAYSHYFWTYNAIPNVLNFAAESKNAAFITGGSSHPRMTTNRYFKLLLDRNYTINAVRTDYLDVCADTHAAPQRCVLYGSHALGAIAEERGLSAVQKAELIALGYVEHTRLYRNGIRSAYRAVQPALALLGIDLQPMTRRSFWEQNPYWLSSIDAMSVLEQMWREILRTEPGSAFFAHVMLPHFPYLYREDCSLTSMDLWEGRELAFVFDATYGGSGSADIDKRRVDRYSYYFQQLQCLYTELDRLFTLMKAADIFDDAIIVVHGDHGSRIVRHEPTSDNAALLTDDDFKDAFSTLYAVKTPGRRGGYDRTIRPLEELLAESFQVPREQDHGAPAWESEHFVYLKRKAAEDGEEMLKARYPPFGAQIAARE
ncbi:MAG: hypothetical protein U1F54_15920 [Burkholderiales bacterium]